MELPGTPEEMVELTVELIRRNGFRGDTYIRPSVYKSSEIIGVRLHNLEHQFVVFAIPFGNYIDIERGISAGTSSWRRNSDTSIPARSKIVGAYVNSAFSKTEAQLNGYDEAIVLTLDGHASEGSAENLFLVRDGVLITPPITDDILEGITRTALMELARTELGVTVVERQVDRSELYIADEVLLCGTGAQISPETTAASATVRWGPSRKASRSSTSTRCADASRRTATGCPRCTRAAEPLVARRAAQAARRSRSAPTPPVSLTAHAVTQPVPGRPEPA
jgi:branched-chain amino acid aminotransferase group I